MKETQPIIAQLEKEYGIPALYIQNIIQLLEEGATLPFIARYRKEQTNSIDDQILKKLTDRHKYLVQLEERKIQILESLQEQGKLDTDLETLIRSCSTLHDLEDIYAPYKLKKKTRAMIALENGLGPLAEAIFANKHFNAQSYINENYTNEEEVIAGAIDIVAEKIFQRPSLLEILFEKTWKFAKLQTEKGKEENPVYESLYEKTFLPARIPHHRVLAMNRAEREKAIKIKLLDEKEKCISFIENNVDARIPELIQACKEAYTRHIRPHIENKLRAILTEEAEASAVELFGKNLVQLLLQAPLKNNRVLALDPGYRMGCKIAAIDEYGKLLSTDVIYITPPHANIVEAKNKIQNIIEKYQPQVVAIGNGTASKETELFVAEEIKLPYTIVNEAGASVYSASELGAKEFPELDVNARSAISIARRLQDPLAELVKIDPKSLGIGQYQHDLNEKSLDTSLRDVVENIVNKVGVYVNKASVSLLQYVAGINKTVAQNIIQFREKNGPFRNRLQLQLVKGMGSKTFEQCAGFLRIPDGDEALDNTGVHPESYALAKMLSTLSKEQKATPTVQDIIQELEKPGRDIRDDLPQVQFRTQVLHLEDLEPGMKLKGIVRNIVDFGAFVDIGVHQDGLVHISQISDSFIQHPMEILSIGDEVNVKITEIDIEKKKISLTMKLV